MTDGTAGPSKSQGLRDAISSKLRLGKGGNKARRGSTPRTSAIAEATHLAHASSISTSSQGSHGGSLESLSIRLRKLREAGDLAEQPPFRIKFVNHKNDATMADVYPTEEYKDVIRKIVEKLRMPHLSNYVLMYKDTDNEEIGVACTDNLREMFSIFEPGSKLQLRIVQQTINNSGALDSIPSIWDNGHTPNIFLHDDGDSDSSHSSESSGDSVDLGKLKLASAAATTAAAAAVEMEEKPKASHLAVEDVADAAVAAAAAASAAAAAAALADAVGTKTEKQENSNASNKAEPPTPVSPASPQVSPKVDDKPPEDELRTAIAMMSNNLTLAIESLGTKLATNFDRLSNEQAKIIDSLAHAKTTVSDKVESKVTEKVAETTADAAAAVAAVAVAAAVVAAAAADESDSDDSDSGDEKKTEKKAEEKVEAKVEEKVEEKVDKVEIKVEEKVETKTETKTDEGVTETTTVETKTTEIKVEDVEADKKKDEDKEEEKKEEAAPPAPAKDACDTETINVEIIDEAPPAPAPTPAPCPAPAPVHVHHKKDDCDDKRRADIFKEHLHRANAFAFHSNPYASSFFQHGFSEVGMPSYIRHPCMMQTPFDEPTCSCSGGCSVCLTRKLAEMGYGVNEMQVSSLLSVYNGDTARVIEHVTSCC
ncbi:hypothetical protein GGI19_001039 [Coemansia pectinata]|uniref:PB1 domain-containing protein n=1 Tax=Coemansia pectinata TaxID=1052879 RepID=A0A9W8LDV5_9FUNG|nr:hypothetical protein GGI19_001039 [Coemansia pectinata]